MSLASVNGFLISKLDYLLELAVVTYDNCIICADESIKIDVLDQIIDDTLLLQHASKHKINVNNDEVEESFFETLLDLNSRYDFAEFMIENHLTEDILRNHVKNRLIIKKYLDEYVRKDIQISNDDLIEFYKENIESFEGEDTVRISHILIEKFHEESLEKAWEIKKSIGSPQAFYDKVKECSECPTCCQSGDLGYFIRGELIEELDSIVFNMQVNEISDPILSKYGYHIIIVTDKKYHTITAFEDIKNALKEQLVETEAEIKIYRLLCNLKDMASIEVYV
ncbi:MAG: peptidylprolyl isomerase [Candidatus Cloacimonadales bacterium]|jgi:parvulin-like peptidyl-prolyl isomerase|nr:peptidylprolyl isomerase [Candidatus Cloacimonadales bacterium]